MAILTTDYTVVGDLEGLLATSPHVIDSEVILSLGSALEAATSRDNIIFITDGSPTLLLGFIEAPFAILLGNFEMAGSNLDGALGPIAMIDSFEFETAGGTSLLMESTNGLKFNVMSGALSGSINSLQITGDDVSFWTYDVKVSATSTSPVITATGAHFVDTLTDDAIDVFGSVKFNVDTGLVVSGTVTSVVFNLDGASYSASGFKVNAVDFFNPLNDYRADFASFLPTMFKGNDTLTFGANGQTIAGFKGNDTYQVGTFTGAVIVEEADGGKDTVRASTDINLADNVENLIFIGGGDFVGDGNASNNRIDGNDDDNEFDGQDGNDLIYGNGGDDILEGGDGADKIYGGAGNDDLFGDAGKDALYGGLEDDTYTVDLIQAGMKVKLEDTVKDDGGANDWLIVTSAPEVTLPGGMAFDLKMTGGLAQIETVDLNGTDLMVNITGNNLNNTFYGNEANNRLLGMGGDDILWGGFGQDTAIGGMGADVFVMEDNGEPNILTVADFLQGTDHIGLNTSGAGFPSSMFDGGGAFIANLVNGTISTGEGATILYDGETGALFYDADGDGVGSGNVQIGKLQPGLTLTEADFVPFVVEA